MVCLRKPHVRVACSLPYPVEEWSRSKGEGGWEPGTYGVAVNSSPSIIASRIALFCS
jgi:hypothetical protein